MGDLTPAIIEKNLTPMLPMLQQAIPPALHAVLPAERIMRTIIISVTKLPALTECTMQSIVNAAWSAAVLGLEVDGITGQAYLIPFREKGTPKAQLVIGYKGFNTLGSRSGFTIQGAAVHANDKFDFELGTGGFVKHKPVLTNRGDIVAAYAIASHNSRPSILSVMGREEINAVRSKSPGGRRAESPWNDPLVGFEAMCEKTAKRRLARSMPLNVFQQAAALDGAAEAGKYAYIDPEQGAIVDGETIEGEFSEAPEGPAEPDMQISAKPIKLKIFVHDGEREFTEKIEWLRALNAGIASAKNANGIDLFLKRNGDYLESLKPDLETEVGQILSYAQRRKKEFGLPG